LVPFSVSMSMFQLCGPVWRHVRGEHRVGRGGVAAERDLRGDRRLAILRRRQLGGGDEERFGQDAGQDREGVDRGIEHAETAGRPDPFLAGMPAPHVFLPLDMQPGEALALEQAPRFLDRAVILRVPGGEGDAALARYDPKREVLGFRDGRGGRLLQQ
jgi:hypothetical protein